LGDNATPPFPTLPTGAFALIVANAVRSVLLPRIGLLGTWVNKGNVVRLST
jgi:hypothetical protein